MDDFEFREHDEHERQDNEKERERAPRRIRRDFPRRDNHEEEYAAEVAPTRTDRYELDDDDEREKDATTGRTAGYVGLAFGIASLFMWSIVLGPIAAVTGYYAYSQGSKVWGAWGMGLGILATISYFVLIPFAR